MRRQKTGAQIAQHAQYPARLLIARELAGPVVVSLDRVGERRGGAAVGHDRPRHREYRRRLLADDARFLLGTYRGRRQDTDHGIDHGELDRIVETLLERGTHRVRDAAQHLGDRR